MKKSLVRKNLPLIGTGLVAVGLVGVAIYIHANSARKLVVSPTAAAPGSAKSDSHLAAGSSPSGTASDNSTAASSSTQATNNATSVATGPAPTVPTGPFLSSGSIPLADQENSTCQTTAGSTCNLKLTSSDGATIKYALDQATSTDSMGYSNFYWTPQARGLTAGAWTVEAVATLNGQTATAPAGTLTVTP